MAGSKSADRGDLGFEAELFRAADKLRGNLEPSEYKHVALGLIFLKYISEAFDAQHAKLSAEAYADPEDPEEYLADHVFWVPQEARWKTLQDNAKRPEIVFTDVTTGKERRGDIGNLIDNAMESIERANVKVLKDVLPKDYGRPQLDKRMVGELVDLFSNITLKGKDGEARDLLGRAYEYFISQFAGAEGKRGGEFFTPRSVVQTIVEMLEPTRGRVYDPACGSGGMFVQSETFVGAHQGKRSDIAIYGQERNHTTWRLCKMNLAVRGIDADIAWNNEGSFTRDAFPNLKFDYAMAKVVVTDDRVSKAFIYWLMRTKPYRDEVLSSVTGSTVKHTSPSKIGAYSFFLPPRHDQDAICETLGAFDDKIELNRRMNETLEAMAQAIFRDWFVDFGPVRRKMEGATDPVAIMGGLTPDPARAAELAALFPNALSGDAPVGWAWGDAKDLVEFNPTETLRKGTPAPYLEMAALPTHGPSADAPVMRPFGSGMRFRNGDALLARITPCLENGKTCFVDQLDDESVGWGSTEFFVLRARRPAPRALAYLLCRDPDFRAAAVQSMTGTSGRQRAQIDTLKAFEIAVPPPQALTAFADLINPLFDKIAAAAAENRTLAETRDYLLPRLMSGQVRVGDGEAPA